MVNFRPMLAGIAAVSAALLMTELALTRTRLAGAHTRTLLSAGALAHAFATLVALACLVRIRVGLDYSPDNLTRMLAIYTLAALPFFTGGAVVSLAFARLTDRI